MFPIKIPRFYEQHLNIHLILIPIEVKTIEFFNDITKLSQSSTAEDVGFFLNAALLDITSDFIVLNIVHDIS